MQKEQRIQQQTFILIIIVIVLGLLYYLYHRKNKLYLSIVKQNQEAIKRETELHRRIKELKPFLLHGFYFRKICFLLTHRREKFRTFPYIRAYYERRKNLQRQFYNKRQSSRNIRTNRTYLSRIINEQSKLSFTHYVNRFRIEEAIRLLSDPNNETPLKAISTELGFNSISTFYNLFQSSVGMTPPNIGTKLWNFKKSNRLSFALFFILKTAIADINIGIKRHI